MATTTARKAGTAPYDPTHSHGTQNIAAYPVVRVFMRAGSVHMTQIGRVEGAENYVEARAMAVAKSAVVHTVYSCGCYWERSIRETGVIWTN